MSSEALERAQKALRTPDLEWAGDLVHGLANDVVALSAELDEARADYWRDVAAHYQAKVAAEAALAVTREREQRLREALEECANAPNNWLNHDAVAALRERARAALVDEPAAATLAEPEQATDESSAGRWSGQRQPAGAESAPTRSKASASLSPGSASAAADEPGETPCR